MIKSLQSIELQKSVIIIGAFSIFESRLQEILNCVNGFREVRKILKTKSEIELKQKFELYYMAINTLKHGKGSSYNKLALEKKLPFQLINPKHQSFEEGDVSQTHTLIKVDDQFIYDCLNIIERIVKLLNDEEFFI